MLTLWPARKRKRQKRKRETYIFLSQALERQDLLKDYCEDCSEFRFKKKKKNHTPKIIVLRVGNLGDMRQNPQ